MKKITQADNFKDFKVGEELLFTGIILTMRDQAHKRISELIIRNKDIPIDFKNAIIYYCGPTKTPEGKVIGSCGPTTSSRMDQFTPLLLKLGIKAMIGKGRRSQEIKHAIKRYKAVYFLTYAGCGALLSKCVRRKKIIAFSDLGPEAICELEVEDFPLIVGIDSKGRDIFEKN